MRYNKRLLLLPVLRGVHARCRCVKNASVAGWVSASERLAEVCVGLVGSWILVWLLCLWGSTSVSMYLCSLYDCNIEISLSGQS